MKVEERGLLEGRGWRRVDQGCGGFLSVRRGGKGIFVLLGVWTAEVPRGLGCRMRGVSSKSLRKSN